MLILKPNEVCPYSSNCPYNKNTGFLFCHGTVKRKNDFYCNHIDNNGKFIMNCENFLGRNVNDKTGKMIPLSENQ